MKIKNILVSQPVPTDRDKCPYAKLGDKYGINVDYIRFIKIEGVQAKEFRLSKIDITTFNSVIFTSKQAVDHFFRIAKEMRIEIAEDMKYFCISESTALYLQKYVQYRKRKIFHGQLSLNDLIDVIKKHRDDKFLLPCADIQKPEIQEILDQHEINYQKAVIYRTLPSDLTDLDISKYDMLVFFTPVGVGSLYVNFPDFVQNETLIAGFGATTAKAVSDAGLTLNIEAPTKANPSMTMAIEEFLKQNNKRK